MSERELTIATADGAALAAAREDTAEIPALSVSAATLSLCLTALIFWCYCPFPPHGPLSWTALEVHTASYVFSAVAFYFAILCVFYRLFNCSQEMSLRTLAFQSSTLAAWVPMVVLLQREHSPWIALLLPLFAAHSMLFVQNTVRIPKQSDSILEPNDLYSPTEEHLLFSLQSEPGIGGSTRPAPIAAVSLQCGIGLLLLDQHLFAGICLACASAYLAWKLRTKAPAPSRAVSAPRKALAFLSKILLLMAMTAIVLLPFHKDKAIAGSATGLLRFSFRASKPAQASTPRHQGSFFSGFILVPLTNPNKQLLRPPRIEAHNLPGNAVTKPLEINFDGVYWYFDPMEERPQPDAPTVRGDSIKANIHSTYHSPVVMIAHQGLNQAISMSCCRAMRVQVTNAEGYLGPIHLEIMLSNTAVSSGVRNISLGAVLIPSTAEEHGWIYRQPVDETLTFHFPATSPMKKFNEITVEVEPESDFNERGAHLAIRKFTLVP